jgi:hypothetical protein
MTQGWTGWYIAGDRATRFEAVKEQGDAKWTSVVEYTTTSDKGSLRST